MILASILTCYFILLICQQRNDRLTSRGLYILFCIRRGMLSKREIVAVSRFWHTKRQYYGYNGLDGREWYNLSYISARFYLSSNGRLYREIFTNGHKSVQYYSYRNAIKEIQDIATYSVVPDVINARYTWDIIISEGSYTISWPAYG